jgi:Uma2 family endonuclease
MGATTLVSVQEYLKTSYRPDVDYIDGELLERNMGEWSHGRMQLFLGGVFERHEQDWRLIATPEQRVQVKPERFRVPDICVTRLEDAGQQIVRTPPVLCVEILSSEDTLTRLKPRIDDYAAMGVANIWVVDPWKREAYYASAAGYAPVMDGVLRIPGTPVEVSLTEALARLDV